MVKNGEGGVGYLKRKLKRVQNETSFGLQCVELT